MNASLSLATKWSYKLSKRDLVAINKIINWEVLPFFSEMGRTAWFQLQDPIKVNYGQSEYTLNSVKIKGVGLKDHNGLLTPSTKSTYLRSVSHLGISKNGKFTNIIASPAPMGAISYIRASIEFMTALRLSEDNLESEMSLLLYKYNETSPEFGELAVIVAGIPNSFPDRGDSLLAGIINKSALTQMWRSYGSQLMYFHESGFYRHNANPRNFCMLEGKMLFIDLDSTRPLLECSEKSKPLQILRDVAGGIFHMFNSIIFTDFARDHTIEEIHSILPLEAYLSAYFPKANLGLIRNIIRELRGIFDEMYRSRRPYGIGKLQIESSWLEMPYQEFMTLRDKTRTKGIDRPIIFARIIPHIYELYDFSSHCEKIKLSVTKQELIDLANDFYSPKKVVG